MYSGVGARTSRMCTVKLINAVDREVSLERTCTCFPTSPRYEPIVKEIFTSVESFGGTRNAEAIAAVHPQAAMIFEMTSVSVPAFRIVTETLVISKIDRKSTRLN